MVSPKTRTTLCMPLAEFPRGQGAPPPGFPSTACRWPSHAGRRMPDAAEFGEMEPATRTRTAAWPDVSVDLE